MRIALVIIGIVVLLGIYLGSVSFGTLPKISTVNTPSIESALVAMGYGIGFIILVLGAMIPRRKEVMHVKVVSEDEDEGASHEEAVRILKKRYAKGEITKQQMDQMRKDLDDQ